MSSARTSCRRHAWTVGRLGSLRRRLLAARGKGRDDLADRPLELTTSHQPTCAPGSRAARAGAYGCSGVMDDIDGSRSGQCQRTPTFVVGAGRGDALAGAPPGGNRPGLWAASRPGRAPPARSPAWPLLGGAARSLARRRLVVRGARRRPREVARMLLPPAGSTAPPLPCSGCLGGRRFRWCRARWARARSPMRAIPDAARQRHERTVFASRRQRGKRDR